MLVHGLQGPLISEQLTFISYKSKGLQFNDQLTCKLTKWGVNTWDNLDYNL